VLELIDPDPAPLPLALLVPASCECLGCEPPAGLPAAPPEDPERVRWAIPGVWDDEPAAASAPVAAVVGPVVAAAQAAVAALTAVADEQVVELPGAVALAEAAALHELIRGLRVLLLPRVADVEARKLFRLGGFHSVGGWLKWVAPDAVSADRTLAGRLATLPTLDQAVDDRRVSLRGAAEVAKVLRQVGLYLDRSDGLIDGQPGEPIITSVVDNTLELVCRARGGAEESFVTALSDRITLIHLAAGSQAERVEAALVLLAEHLSGEALKEALAEQTGAVLPNLLEKQQQAAEDKRGLSAQPNSDGSWQVEGRLTAACGERLFTVLAAEARRDPGNPVDTLARQHAREQALLDEGLDPFVHGNAELPRWDQDALRDAYALPLQQLEEQAHDLAAAGLGLSAQEAEDAALLVPRSRSRRLHDALDRLLTRYLEAGLGGAHDKVPVQISITASSRLVEQQPGALPARTGSGRLLARSLLKRWWGDAHVTTLLLDRGWRPLGEAHSGRTLTAAERRALAVQYDNRCAGADCCPGTPDPLMPLVPHHVTRYSEHGQTQLEESLPLCDRAHHDLHTGKKLLRLRDGRLIDENGYITND
jgi:hypothetical protein